MLKYEKIIRILSIEEKVELLTSVESYKNRKIDNYMLPEFLVTDKSFENNTNDNYPTFNTLGTTWNKELIEKIGKNIGSFNKCAKNGKIIGVPVNISSENKEDCFSNDVYLTGQMASHMLKGINTVDALGCAFKLTKNEYQTEDVNEDLIPYEFAIKEGKPYAIYCDGIDSINFAKELNFTNLLIAEVVEKTDIVKALFNDCDLVIAKDAKEVILEAIENYKQAKIDLYYQNITRVEFDELQRTGSILNPDLIDKKLDVLLEKISLFDEKMIVSQNAEDYRDYASKSLSQEIANESIILVKNNGILPLSYIKGAHLIGDAIEKDKTNGDVQVESLVDVFRKSYLNIANAVHGYSNDIEDNSQLINKALEIVNSSSHEVCIVFLDVPKNETKLPNAQLELLYKLYKSNKKIIAVVQTENPIDYSFVNLCSAVIQTGLFVNGYAKAICDVISGTVNPSGKMNTYCPLSFDLPVDPVNKHSYAYPLGHGLHYSSFEYSNIKVTQQGVSFVIKNASHLDGYEVAQMYISKLDDYHNPVYKKLKGFNKVFIQAGESVKVFIPFDEYTFRQYNEELNCYQIEAGRYAIAVGSSADNIGVLAEVTLDGKTYDVNGFTNEDITAVDSLVNIENFLKFNDRKEGKAVERGISLVKKIVISSLIAVYFNAIMIPLLVNAIGGNNIVLAVVIGVLTLALDVVYAIYLIKSIKNRKPKQPKIINDTASLVFDKLNDYSEVAKITYPKPIAAVPEGIEVDEDGNEVEVTEEVVEEVVEEEIIEEPIVEEIVEEVVEEEVIEEKEVYALEINEEFLISDIQYDDKLEIEQWVKQFVEFALSKGLIIEHKSARALFAALSSSRLVILRSVSSELIPFLNKILFEYFDSKYTPVDFSKIENYNDLIWTKAEDKFVCSDFVNVIHRAKALKNHINLVSLENVDFTTFEEKLGKVFTYFSSRLDDVCINLSNSEEAIDFVLSKNMVFIATSNDENYLETLPKNVAENSLSIEVTLRVNEIYDSEAKFEIPYMSQYHLDDLMKVAKNVNYIFEKQWKKFDDIEEQINELSPYSIHNKTVLCFESLAAFVLSCAVEIDEFIDLALASRIAPSLKSLKAYQVTNGDANLYGIITKIFGEDNVPQTKRTLKKPM